MNIVRVPEPLLAFKLQSVIDVLTAQQAAACRGDLQALGGPITCPAVAPAAPDPFSAFRLQCVSDIIAAQARAQQQPQHQHQQHQHQPSHPQQQQQQLYFSEPQPYSTSLLL